MELFEPRKRQSPHSVKDTSFLIRLTPYRRCFSFFVTNATVDESKEGGNESSDFIATVCAQLSLDCLPAICDLLEIRREETRVLMFCCFGSTLSFCDADAVAFRTNCGNRNICRLACVFNAQTPVHVLELLMIDFVEDRIEGTTHQADGF